MPDTELTPSDAFAVLLDFDGTLIDTEPMWMAGEVDLLARYGVPWTQDDAKLLCGTSKETSMGALLGHMALYDVDMTGVDPEAFYDQLWRSVAARIAAQDLPLLPGAADLLAALCDADVPCALVSASPRPLLDGILARFPRNPLRLVVDGGSVAAGKPAPDGYLFAAHELGVDPRDCVVLEDTISGVQAGLAAGAVVVAVPGQHPVPAQPGMISIDSLVGLTPLRLRQLRDAVRCQRRQEAMA
jgi:HAD superfamily hydrolase (TIGR01509 family)